MRLGLVSALAIHAVVAVGVASQGLPAASADDAGAVLDPVCSEPAGQSDTPPHPRLRRATVSGVDVAVLLPPRYRRDGRRYPVVYLMHGAQGDEDSWIQYGGLLPDTAARPRRQQAIVVMPRMGVMTGIAVDWVDGHRKDASFVGRTLVRWVDRTYRTRDNRRHRAIAGYSGGGLSATHLAQRFPGVFGQLGAFSAPLDLRSPSGIAAAYAMFEAEKLCAGDSATAAGPLGDPIVNAEAWEAVDPVANAAALRATTVWLSSGNGAPCYPGDVANLAYPTAMTEASMRLQGDEFSRALTAVGIAHVHNRIPCGLHWWTIWRPSLNDFWDVAAARWRR